MKDLKLLSRISKLFQNLNNLDQQIKEILDDVGSSMDIGKCFTLLYEDKEITKNAFEWCTEEMLAFKDIFMENGYICLDNISELPQGIIDIIEPHQIKSLVLYPMIIEKQIIGLVVFGEYRYKREWKEKELEILNMVSTIITNAYEKKFFKHKLATSEANFNNFFESIDDMFIVSDLDGNIIHCNKSLIKKLGYSLSELKKMTIIDLHPIDQRQDTSITIEKMINGEIDYCSLEVESKSGAIYLLETRIWFGKWDKRDCIYSVSKDVTQENENFKLFSKIFENNPLPMAITSIDEKKFIKVNPMFVKKTGYSNEEIIGKTPRELGIFVECENLKDVSNKLENSKHVKNEELIFKCKDGKLLNGLFSVEEISSQGKKSLLTVMFDITEKVELIKNIEDKCQKLTNIIEGTNLGTWEWDIQTGKFEINKQWAKMIGYSLEELSDKRDETWFKFAHPEDLKISNKLIEKHLNGETEYYEFEIRMKHKDGKWIWVQDIGKVTERDNNGLPLKMFGTHSDITIKKDAEKELIESEKRFFLALDETKAGLWDYDMINDKLFLSPMWKSILGYSDNEIENSIEAWRELWNSNHTENILKAVDDYMKGKSKNFEVINRLKHKDGDWRWILTRGGILRDESDVPYRWIGTNIDITREQEQALELERFFTINLDLFCITNIEGYFLKINRAWEDILGYSSEQLKGRKFLEFIHPDDIDTTIEALKQLGKGEKVTHFINRYISADGNYRYIEWRSNPYEDLIYAAARDITERVEYENRILEISNKDALTGAYNRRYVFDRTEEIIKEYKNIQKTFSVCILDIDFFKKINDNYGHQAGDYVLKEFTRIIEENLRPYDILGRYGGEEFIVILNNIDEEQGSFIIKRILDIIRDTTFVFNGNDIKFTFSGGIASCKEINKDEITIDKLVEIADRRMYKAKNTGRNKIVLKTL